MSFVASLYADSLQDTPTIGAGFWAEQWVEEESFDRPHGMMYQQPTLSPAARLVNGDFSSVIHECLPGFSSYLPLSSREDTSSKQPIKHISTPHGVALSGIGNITRQVTYLQVD
jgi:L-asparaginase